MKFNKKELSTIHEALTVDNDQYRRFPITELSTVVEIGKQLKKYITNNNVFIDGELELDTEAKSLVLKCIERDWPMTRAEEVLSIKDKLSK